MPEETLEIVGRCQGEMFMNGEMQTLVLVEKLKEEEKRFYLSIVCVSTSSAQQIFASSVGQKNLHWKANRQVGN